MKKRFMLAACLLGLSVPANAYVSYSFTGYSDEEDPRFPEFKFYTNDFLSRSAPGEQAIVIDPSTWVYSQNIALLSVVLSSGPYAKDYFKLTQRYAYPGRENYTIGFNPAVFATEGVHGNGIGLLTVARFDGDIPEFTFVESDPGPFPGGTNIPIGGYPQQPGGPAEPGGVPEPATWLSMIAGMSLVGAALRRRKATIALRAAV